MSLHRTLTAPLLLGLALSAAAFTAPAWAQADPKAARFYEDALVRYEKKDLPGAIIQLKNALQIDQRMLPVQVLLGKALLETGDVSAAEVAFNEAIKLGVNKAEVVVPLAQALLAQSKQKALLESPALSPAGLPAGVQLQLLLVRAAAYADLGNTTLAFRTLDEARVLNPQSADVWSAEVPIRIRTGQLSQASTAADKALDLAPQSAGAYYQKASVLHVQGNLKVAIETYKQVLKMNPEHVDARVALIGLYLDLGQLKDAKALSDELLKAAPKEPRGAYLSALIADKEGRSADAQVALKKVTDLIDPVPMGFLRYRPQFLMLNGQAHFGLKQNEKAKVYLEAFQRLQPTSPVIKLLANLYLQDGKAADAAALLESYRRANEGDAQAMSLLASAYLAEGKSAKAAALVQEALKTKDNPAFRAALGLGLMGSGQTANGVVQLEAAFKKDPKQVGAGAALVQFYMRQGQSRKALAVAEALVKQRPSATFYNLLGMTRGGVADTKGARAAFEKALQLDPDFAQAAINLARLDTATGAFEAATARLNEMLRINARNTDAMGEFYLLALRKGDKAEARRWLEKARDAAPPKDVQWSLALVEFLLNNQQSAAALEAAKDASGRAPENFDVLLAYAQAQVATGDLTGAKSSLTRATRFADFNPDRQVAVAQMQMAAGNPSGAAYSLDKALSGQPTHIRAQAMMAEVELLQGQTAKADQRAREITAQAPKMAIGMLLQGDVALAKGDAQGAVALYKRAGQIEPSTLATQKTLLALLRQGRFKEAVQLGEQWLIKNSTDVAVRKQLGDIHAVQGQWGQSKAAYLAVLKTRPTDPEALNSLANVLIKMKDPASVAYAEKALTSSPGNPLVIDTLGWALFQNGQTDRALQMLRDARLRMPDHPEIRYHLAAVLEATGRRAEALAEAQASLDNRRSYPDRPEAQLLLDRLKK